MKSNKLTVKLNKPAGDVFAFVTNPKNSPKWMDFIVYEESSDYPPKVGTSYRNKDTDGQWYDYEVTAVEKDKLFELSQAEWGFHVRYTLTPVGANSTKFDFHEWVDKDELDELEKQETLERLKKVIEESD